MKITWGLENVERVPGTVVTLGTYDGVHLGHRDILLTMNERKRERSAPRTLVITFHPHPQQVLRKHNSQLELLTTIEERLERIAAAGVDETLVITFTQEFSKTSYRDFLSDVIAKDIGTTYMVVGFNHAFGRDREGDATHLKEMAPTLGIEVEQVPPRIIDGEPISSTRIRNALRIGDLNDAIKCLGYRYRFSGEIVHGDGIGRTLGYPTANLSLPMDKMLPADGVYAAYAIVEDKRYDCALSVGTKPTVSTTGERVAEGLLLDFEGDIYGRTLQIECVEYLRQQETFDSVDVLKAKIGEDVTRIRTILARSPGLT